MLSNSNFRRLYSFASLLVSIDVMLLVPWFVILAWSSANEPFAVLIFKDFNSHFVGILTLLSFLRIPKKPPHWWNVREKGKKTNEMTVITLTNSSSNLANHPKKTKSNFFEETDNKCVHNHSPFAWSIALFVSTFSDSFNLANVYFFRQRNEITDTSYGLGMGLYSFGLLVDVLSFFWLFYFWSKLQKCHHFSLFL
jgi:hypothetical protein